MNPYFVLDVGTTNVKVHVYSQGKLLDSLEEKMSVRHPQPGWAEQDPEEVVKVVYRLLDTVEAKYGKPAGVGLTNQRGSTVVWYKESGEPLCNLITWQDTRTRDLVEEYSSKTIIKLGRAVGLATNVVSKFFKALKKSRAGAYLMTLAYAAFGTTHSSMHLRWIMDNVEGAKTALNKGEALFGTIDSWIAWNLCGRHITDYTNASATGIFNPFKLRWSETVIKLLEIPRVALPKFVSNDEPIGLLKHLDAPLLSMIADQQASLYVACARAGGAKITCSTGAFIDVNVGDRPLPGSKGIYPMIALATKNNVTFLLEGFLTSAGCVVEWLMELGLVDSYSELAECLTKGREGVIFIPALNGLGTPFARPDATAAFLNLTSATRKEDIVRGALEGVAAMSAKAIEHLEKTSEIRIKSLIADGGLARCDPFLQMIADFSGKPVARTEHVNNSAYGAYLLCECVARGVDPLNAWQPPKVEKIFEPRASKGHYSRTLHKAIKVSLDVQPLRVTN
ncbi:MAG: FGGY family carbohydrate kinase [Thermofilaceae archaeon]|nr:FGGY family carbohydrate kinase [Thermofilaceae archaeon]MCX8181003.1 FGGY family carbohydrate kinase [Thermofilaceae archaeon]MDW8004108.1 FGGY family carbohydrate kinase [Thermofilaceae archaeon]